jgi:molybdopterin-containing oxidoreductase family iron-sulfur binding subunit
MPEHPHPPPASASRTTSQEPATGDTAPIEVVRVASGINRRQALGAMAASMALANTACSPPRESHAEPWVNLPEARGGALPLYYASAFVRDGYAQGVLVGTQEGRPIKIEGNPGHPSSLGATSIHAQASVLELWDPDRSTAVRQRLARPTAAGPLPAGRTPVSSWAAFESAWRARARDRLRAGTAGHGTLRVLTGPLTSPTARALLAALLAGEPGARWHVHAPLADPAAAAGATLAFGRPVLPVLHFDRARCVLALGADPFSDGPGAVRHAMDWATARAAARDAHADAHANLDTARAHALPRLLAAEVQPGLFGARADDRCALPPAQIDALAARIAARWLPAAPGSDATTSPALTPEAAAFAERAIAALAAAGPDALIAAGPGLSARTHVLAHALNQRLGAVGRTLDLIAPPDEAPEAGTLADLLQALAAGTVDTLVIVDANPAYDAPAGLDVPAALARAALVVHAGLYDDETAALADWHLPLTHACEQWGDARGHEGSAALLQPAIAPLYDTRSAIELFALLADDTLRDGRDLVRRQWQSTQAQGGDYAQAFEGFWRDSLRAGVVAGSAAPALALPEARVEAPPGVEARAAPGVAPPQLAALFVADVATHDGRFANNAWLQELPRPFTKFTWDNALGLGPRTAARLGLETGDVARARLGERAIVAPVWVSALHAEDVVTVPLGGGRRRAGRVGDGVGFNAQALRADAARRVVLTLERTGRRHDFPRMQHEFDEHERDLVRTVPPGGALPPEPERAALYPVFASPEHAWAMTIDLDACIGCNACMIACQAENNIPVVGPAEVARGRAMHWIRVDRYDVDDGGGSAFQPVPCMHCERAPCELVCPVGATVHDSEGLNVQVYNRCIGTRFCSNNCPYKVRRFNFLQFVDRTTETLKAQRNPDVTVRQRGVMEKCSYCLQRISRARRNAQATGVAIADGDVVTACQGACPTRAIRFGDLRDPASEVAHAKASPRHYALLGELNTRPRTTYLARVVAKRPKPDET